MKTVVASVKLKEVNQVVYAETLTESTEEQYRNWLPKRKPKTDFIVSPADVVNY